MSNYKFKSDFRDIYDLYFDNPCATKSFERLSRSGPDRKEIFGLLKSKKLMIPERGTVKYLYERMSRHYDVIDIIVYLDINSHRGEGKIKITFDVGEHNEEMLLEKYGDCYGSLFIYSGTKYPKSYRTLYVGDLVFFFTYISFTDEWRSNYGGAIVVYEGSKPEDEPYYRKELLVRKFDYPLYAIDYVCSHNRDDGHCIMYLDLNIAPQFPKEVFIPDRLKDRFPDLLTNHYPVETKFLFDCKEIAEELKRYLDEERS